MSSEARLRANRQNAKLSTGPRSKAGKARVAANAQKHGLSMPLPPEDDSRLVELSKLLAGPKADAEELQFAYAVAEAEFEILRVRRVRCFFLDRKSPESQTLENRSAGQGPDIASLTRDLRRLDRYEQRALSRKKSAIRALDRVSALKA